MNNRFFIMGIILVVLGASTPLMTLQLPQPITTIQVRIVTGNRPAAGTDDPVFLGLGGREFRIQDQNLAFNDFASGSEHTYTFGAASSVSPATLNDPRDPQLTTDDLFAFPVYIRKNEDTASQSVSSWNVEEVTVTVNPGRNQIVYSALEGPANIWLTNDAGLILYLKRRR
ncbi:MAG TPA: PLAT/LH2 domain-containing protein [Blastocatellia bacterium]|nr:PLAT/LH2 domain-containing protein [Blastocatellia bacterium]